MVNTRLVSYRERELSIVTQTDSQLNVALSQLQRGKWWRIVTQTNSQLNVAFTWSQHGTPRIYGKIINPQTSPYSCSDWDLCHVWRARSLRFSLSADTILFLYCCQPTGSRREWHLFLHGNHGCSIICGVVVCSDGGSWWTLYHRGSLAGGC